VAIDNSPAPNEFPSPLVLKGTVGTAQKRAPAGRLILDRDRIRICFEGEAAIPPLELARADVEALRVTNTALLGTRLYVVARGHREPLETWFAPVSGVTLLEAMTFFDWPVVIDPEPRQYESADRRPTTDQR
jgi:hypothetical protein